MAQSCNICNNINRLEIDRLLIQNLSLASIGRTYHVSQDSLRNHKEKHVSRQLSTSFKSLMDAQNQSMLSDMQSLISRTKDILDKAESNDSLKISLSAIREVRESYKFLSQVAFEYARSQEIELQIQREQGQDANKDKSIEIYDRIQKRLSPEENTLFHLLLSKIDSSDKIPLVIHQDLSLGAKALNMLEMYKISMETPEDRLKKDRPKMKRGNKDNKERISKGMERCFES